MRLEEFLEAELLVVYWAQNKDVLGIPHFGELPSETMWLYPQYETKLHELINLRFADKLCKYRGDTLQPDIKQRILQTKEPSKLNWRLNCTPVC